ncbi:hypothetical protein HRbin21_00004 [bacterium HR21]|nr:hypothetical protein HRbin21_00004 [bacterium HR21]
MEMFSEYPAVSAWEVLDTAANAAERLQWALRKKRGCILLPWTHPAALPDFMPPFDWERTPSGRFPPGKQLLFRLLQRAPRFDPRHPIPGEEVRSLVVFRYDAIGDYLVTTPLLRWLRQGLPQARLCVVTSTRNDGLVGQDPCVDEHVPLHPMHGVHPSWVRAIVRLRGPHQVVYALVFTHMSKAAFLARSIAPEAEYIAPRHWERAYLYGLVFHRQPEHCPWRQHWAQTLLQIGCRTLAPCVPVEPSPRLHVPVSAEACERVWSELERRGLGTVPPLGLPVPARGSSPLRWEPVEGMPYAVVNLSAYSKNRRWAVHHALVVCRELLRRIPGIALVVTAAPQQRRQVETLVQAVRDSRCRAFQGSLSELIALVAGAAWVLSPDTSVVHLASALGKPVVALYSELIKVAEWYPFGVPSVCVLSPLWGGVTFVPPAAIVEAVERLVQEVIPAGAVIPPVPLPSGGALSGSATGKC